MTTEEGIQAIINYSTMDFIHICKPELCLNCHGSSCSCNWRANPVIGGVNYHCPYCGNIMQYVIITSSPTSINYQSIVNNQSHD